MLSSPEGCSKWFIFAGTEAGGDSELINKGENSHPNHVEKCQRMTKEGLLCLVSVLDAYQRGR